MIPGILDFAAKAKRDFGIASGQTLEVGSRDVNGSIRSVFNDATSYIGIDLAEGKSVDVVLDGNELHQMWGPESFDTVLCCEALEHNHRFWLCVENMRRVLRRGGTMLITTPTFHFPEHRYPVDCYRFGMDAYRNYLFYGFKLLRLEKLRDASGFEIIAGIGVKP